uniref:Uncharacterized protein n=1 Tax=Rhizophora mucronata TaxID=61149 RepID=A0A2P2PAB1_RHIMU
MQKFFAKKIRKVCVPVCGHVSMGCTLYRYKYYTMTYSKAYLQVFEKRRNR